MHATLLLLLFCCITHFQGYCQHAVSAFEVDPYAIVAEHVDATSGAWREEENDLFVASRVPFVLRRFYSSQWGEWKFFPHCSLLRGSIAPSTSVITTFESNGSPLRFVQTEGDKAYHFCPLDQHVFCNTAHGPISRKTNYANCLCEKKSDQISLTLPDGTVRTYEKVSQASLGPLCTPFSELSQKESFENIGYFRLVLEVFPNHACIYYRYDEEGRLSSLEVVHDPRLEGKTISFSYEGDLIQVAVDGRIGVSYNFVHGSLVQVNRVQKPSVCYLYQNALLVRKELPEGHFQAISYDDNNKVKAIFGPHTDTPLFTFSYTNNETEGVHAKGYRIRFHHSKQLVQSIELLDGNGPYRSDHFVWSNDSPISRLLGQSTYAKDGSVLWAIKNEYTDDGDLCCSKFFSCTTDVPDTSIALDANGLATGDPESETPKCIYKGPSKSISEQNDGCGNSVEYTYKAGTTVVSKRLEKTLDQYTRRSFYKYDDITSALLQEIHDDGCQKAENDLYRVTQRTIFEVQQRKYPKVGLDEEVLSEKRYDTKSKSEKLVRRLRLLFDTDNNIVKKELYDTQDVLAKSEEFSYDSHGNCIRHVNPIGQVVLKTYDANDNCIKIEECASGRITEVEFDCNNCPTSSQTRYLDNTIVTTASVYDAVGNKLIAIDRYGNATSYLYDAFSRLVSITYPHVLDEHARSICPEVRFSYDIFNNIVAKTDPKGYVELCRYTSSGKLLRVDYPDGSVEQFDYSGDRLIKRFNRDASCARYSYDKKKRLTAVETFTQNPDTPGAHCISQQKFVYSYKNYCIEAQRPNGSFVQRDYDLFGRVISEIESTSTTPAYHDRQASKTEYEYDTLHRPHRIKRWIDDASFITECVTYDDLDRVHERKIEEPDNTTSAHLIATYDAFGNDNTS